MCLFIRCNNVLVTLHCCLSTGIKPVPRDIFTLPLVGELFYILLKYIIQGGVILNLLESKGSEGSAVSARKCYILPN